MQAKSSTENIKSILNPDSPYLSSSSKDHDQELLESLGYKQEFKRDFGLWTTFGVSFTVLGLLPSFAATMNVGLAYGGTAGMVWGWLIAMIPIQCIAMSMAELCSAMPTSGGLYYAAMVLAPNGFGPLAAWLTGWSNWISQITNSPSINYSLASMIFSIITIYHPNFQSTSWQIFLLTCFLTLLQAWISGLPTRFVARFNTYGSIFNVVALVISLIIILVKADRKQINSDVSLPRFASTKKVWGEIHNGTQFPDGIAIMMSFVSVIWTMSGYDSAMHVSEECSNADVASPRAIVMTSAVGASLGWILQVIVAYTVVDIDGVFESSLDQPWASYLLQILPQNLTILILILTTICGFSMGQGGMVAASRVTYAYARDDCFGPWLSPWVREVNQKTLTPINAIWFNGFVGILLALLILAGDTAVSAVFSIGAIASFVGFSIPIGLRVWFLPSNTFKPGRWHLGRWSRLIGSFGVVFVMVMIPIMCLPAQRGKDLTPALMNWTAVVYGGWMILIIIWWILTARHWFRGPKLNIEHTQLNPKMLR